jgi:hypothetical protein
VERTLKRRALAGRRLTTTCHAGAGVVASGAAVVSLLLGASGKASAAPEEDIEFVAEHLPEVAMDNRYAALPLGVPARCATESRWQVQGGYASITTGELELTGPMLAASWTVLLSSRWQLGIFGFYDDLSFGGGSELRPLDPQFSNDIPLDLPADARFDDLGGSALDVGMGAALRLHGEEGFLGDHEWLGGLLLQRVALNDYRTEYTVLSGAGAGVTGSLDYSADYDFVTPFAGLELRRVRGAWSIAPRILFAMPLPRRPITGHITGPGFDISGDTADAGKGSHFGDPSLTLGLGVTYEPLGLTLDLGSTLTQALLEPEFHRGIDQNWLISLACRF